MKTQNVPSKPVIFESETMKSVLQFLLLLLPLLIIAFHIESTDPYVSYTLMLFSGWLTWTFIEYYNHRFRMHSNRDHSKIIGYELHMMHHHHPTEIKITATNRIFLFFGNIVLIFLCILFKNWIIVLTGIYTGFVIYTLMHWFLHQKVSAKLVPEVHQFHIHHHCKHPDKCFGVTVTWWDHLFDTIPHQQKEITERIKAFYYKNH